MALESPSVVWPDGFLFGKRMCLCTAEKQAVGLYAVKNHLDAHSVAFVSDGSSTFHMALRLLRSPKPVKLLTTNIAIAVERAMREANETVRQVQVELAGGSVDSEILMVHGDATEETVAEWGKKANVVLVSMRSYHQSLGPTERHPPSLKLITAACNSALAKNVKIVFLADHAKMSSVPDKNNDRPVFGTAEGWSSACKKDDIWFITNRPPSSDLENQPSWMCSKALPNGDLKCFVENAKRLHGLLDDRYVELSYDNVERVSTTDSEI